MLAVSESGFKPAASLLPVHNSQVSELFLATDHSNNLSYGAVSLYMAWLVCIRVSHTHNSPIHDMSVCFGIVIQPIPLSLSHPYVLSVLHVPILMITNAILV